MDGTPGSVKVLPWVKPNHFTFPLFAMQIMNAQLEGSVQSLIKIITASIP